MKSFLTSLFEVGQRKSKSRSAPVQSQSQSSSATCSAHSTKSKGGSTSSIEGKAPDLIANTPESEISPTTDSNYIQVTQKIQVVPDQDTASSSSSSLGLYQTPTPTLEDKLSVNVQDDQDQDTSASFVTALPMYETPILKSIDVNVNANNNNNSHTTDAPHNMNDAVVEKRRGKSPRPHHRQRSKKNSRSRVRTLHDRDCISHKNVPTCTPNGLKPRRSINEIRKKLGIKRLDMDSLVDVNVNVHANVNVNMNVNMNQSTMSELPTAKKTNVSFNSRSRRELSGQHSVTLEFSDDNSNDSSMHEKADGACRKSSIAVHLGESSGIGVDDDTTRRASSPNLEMGEAKTAVGLLLAQKKKNSQQQQQQQQSYAHHQEGYKYQFTQEEEITYLSISKSQTCISKSTTLGEQTQQTSVNMISQQAIGGPGPVPNENNRSSYRIGILPPQPSSLLNRHRHQKASSAFSAVNPYAALHENLGAERDQFFSHHHEKSALYSSASDHHHHVVRGEEGEGEGEGENDQSTLSQDWYNEWYQYEMYKDEQERQAYAMSSNNEKRNQNNNNLNESNLSSNSRQALFEKRDNSENLGEGEGGYDFSPLHDDGNDTSRDDPSDDPFVAKDTNSSWISDISQNTSSDQQRFMSQAIHGMSGLESSALSAPSPLQQKSNHNHHHNHSNPRHSRSVGMGMNRNNNMNMNMNMNMNPLESSALSGPSPLQKKRDPKRRSSSYHHHHQFPPDFCKISDRSDNVPSELTIESRMEHKRLQKEQLIVQALRRLRDNLSLVHDVDMMNVGDEDGPLMKTRMNKEGILTGYSAESRSSIMGKLHHHLLGRGNRKLDREEDTQELNAMYFIASLVNTSALDGKQYDLGRWKPKEWVRNALRSDLGGRPCNNNVDVEISTSSGRSTHSDSLGNSTISTKESSPRRDDTSDEDSALSHTIVIATTLLQKLSLSLEEYVSSSSRSSYEEMIRLYSQLLTIPRHNMEKLISAFTFSTRPSSRNSNSDHVMTTAAAAAPIRRKPLELSKFVSKWKVNQEMGPIKFQSEGKGHDENDNILRERIDDDASDDDLTVSTMESGPTFLKDEADKLSGHDREAPMKHEKVERISEEDSQTLDTSRRSINDGGYSDENKENENCGM